MDHDRARTFLVGRSFIDVVAELNTCEGLIESVNMAGFLEIPEVCVCTLDYSEVGSLGKLIQLFLSKGTEDGLEKSHNGRDNICECRLI